MLSSKVQLPIDILTFAFDQRVPPSQFKQCFKKGIKT